MTLKGHNKHAIIAKPTTGNYGRCELALIGAPCSMIRDTVDTIAKQLTQYDVTYVDADHQAADPAAYNVLTDKINYHQWSSKSPHSEWDQKLMLADKDLLLINGNHFVAKRQVVFCTIKKKQSLQRKLDRLTDIQLIILDEGVEAPHDFLLEKIHGKPVVSIHDVEAICDRIKAIYTSLLPPVKGLVLAGGKSQRMGQSKAHLKYHDQEQVYHAAQQLAECEVEPYLSCATPEQDQFAEQYGRVYDTYTGLGPYGAILSALRQDPDAAWLTIACDQPLLSAEHLKRLIQERQPRDVATCYHNPETGFPEPLITLWEPKGYGRMLQFLAQGYSCPRKVLINSAIHEIHVEDTTFMRNANTPAERDELLGMIGKR